MWRRDNVCVRSRLLQPGVFRPCFLENPNVRVGVLPQRKEIVVGAFRLHDVARERERSRQLQARHGVHGIDEHDASMIENPLELGGGLCGLMRRQVRLAANVDGIEAAEASDEADAAQARDRSARRSAALESPLPDRQRSMRTGPEASADT